MEETKINFRTKLWVKNEFFKICKDQNVKVSSSDNLTSTEEKELSRKVQSIRRRGNGVCVLLIETK